MELYNPLHQSCHVQRRLRNRRAVIFTDFQILSSKHVKNH